MEEDTILLQLTKLLKYQAGENIQREGSEQQASKSVCQSSCWYEPPPRVDITSFLETENLFKAMHISTKQCRYEVNN